MVNRDQKALTFGILVGVMVPLLVFLGAVSIWKQLSCAELKVAANEWNSITIGGRSLDFRYNPDSGSVTEFDKNHGYNSSFPARVGFSGGWQWGDYAVTEVNPNYVVLFFRPMEIQW
jgi:hypothetical protein